MTNDKLIELVERYFAAVDGERFDLLQQLLTPDCVFSVKTHNIELIGITAIEGMFRRLWANHATVAHNDFSHVVATDDGRIASQFTVINTELDGSRTYKSNCNFFVTKGSRFSSISVYMAGENTLHAG